MKAFLRRYAKKSSGAISSASSALRRLGSKTEENSDLIEPASDLSYLPADHGARVRLLCCGASDRGHAGARGAVNER